MTLVTPKVACRYYSASYPSLRRWANQGKIKYSRTIGGNYRFDIDEEELQKMNKSSQSKTGDNDTKRDETVIYARVGSLSKKDDLNKQIDAIAAKYPNAIIERDVGSSLDFNRKGFQKILDLICSEKIGKVVVTHKDRISLLMGYEMFEWLCRRHNVEIIVENPSQSDDDDKRARKDELVDDMIAITHLFSQISKKTL